MPLVKRYNFQARQAILSSQLNTNFDDIVSAYNSHQHTNTGTDAPLITSSGIAPGAVTATKFDTGAITLGYAQITSNATTTDSSGTPQDIAGLSVAVTVPTGGRRVRITGYAYSFSTTNSALNLAQFYIREGSTTLQIAGFQQPQISADRFQIVPIYVGTPTAGSHTYKLSMSSNNVGTLSLITDPTYPAFILVEAI